MKLWSSYYSLLLLACLGAASPSGAAEPGPVGDEFLAGNVVLPDSQEAFALCRDGNGTTNRLRSIPAETAGDPARIFVERTDSTGTSLPSIPLDSEVWSTWIRCTRAGTFLVGQELPDYSRTTARIRTFDAAGQQLGDFTTRPNQLTFTMAVHATAGLFAIEWTTGDDGDLVTGQWLDYDGEPRTSAVRLTNPYDRRTWPQMPAIDEAGNVLVTWIVNDPENWGNGPVKARMIDVAGSVLGPVIDVSDGFAAETYEAGTTTNETPGLFTVYWYSPLQGGRVGRVISVDPDAIAPPTTTTTLPPSDDAPQFGPERKIGIELAPAGKDLLTSDGAGNWLRRSLLFFHSYDDHLDGYFVFARSRDNGRHWVPGNPASLDMSGQEMAAAPDGTTMISEARGEGNVRVVISSSSGVDWDHETYAVPASLPWSFAEFSFWSSQSAIATDGSGTWAVAWVVSASQRGDWPRLQEQAVFAAFSNDNGASWSPGQQIWLGKSETGVDISVDTNGQGTWVVAWQTVENHAIWSARTTSTSRTWEAPERLLQLEGLGYYDRTWFDFSPNVPVGSLDLRHADADRWLISFASRSVSSDDADGDIFVLRSEDDGVSWSQPLAVNGYAGTDGATDDSPSLAIDAAGEAMVVWRSYDSLGGRIGTDADILRATSTDAGATWSWPAAVNAGASADSAIEDSPLVAAGQNGAWLAMWQSHEFVSQYAEPPRWTERNLMLAAADFHCGDGNVDQAEECDDGNDISGDGCDSNCTVSGCGNGILNDGEECDDGNDLSDDECVEGCRIATCGDGFRLPFVESCDNGATTFDGPCLPGCVRAQCGDGYVEAGIESCDDGNSSNDDGCTTGCRPARCGDGFLWSGHEECDDQNTSDYDGCVAGCRLATCGDGYVSLGVEECDPARPPIPFHPCQNDCRFVPLCDDDQFQSSYSASDALTVLRCAVGLANECSIAVCDLNGNGTVTVIDAQMALRVAVQGLPHRTCAPVADASTTVAFSFDDRSTFGSMQFAVSFPPELGTFRDDHGRNDCSSHLLGVFSAAGAPETADLMVGSISLNGFKGPAEIMSCTFHFSRHSPPEARDFRIHLLDATGIDGLPYDGSPKLHVTLR